MWECPCVACVDLIFFGARAVFSMDACHLFPQCMLATNLLIGGVTGVMDIEWGLLFALWLSLPCQGQGLLPSCWSGSPQVCF